MPVTSFPTLGITYPHLYYGYITMQIAMILINDSCKTMSLDLNGLDYYSRPAAVRNSCLLTVCRRFQWLIERLQQRGKRANKAGQSILGSANLMISGKFSIIEKG
jgi:hypothetical protein